MHRVELKDCKQQEQQQSYLQFLMHRVELKGGYEVFFRPLWLRFLMHRVELKGFSNLISMRASTLFVPNAPCGVESTFVAPPERLCCFQFLMHRVELKALKTISLYK